MTAVAWRWWVTANVTRWIGADRALEDALLAFESNPETTPERFGPDERKLATYSRKAALAKRPKRPGEWYQTFVRSTAPRTDANISANEEGTEVQLRLDSPDGRGAFDLGDELAARLIPRLVAVSATIELRDPDEDTNAAVINAIRESSSMYEPELTNHGLVGLAPRTYLGPEVVSLIGRDRIEALALPRKWFPSGGVRIDLVPEPWQATAEQLVQPWQEAMTILRPSEVFSTIEGMHPTGVLIARPGARWP